MLAVLLCGSLAVSAQNQGIKINSGNKDLSVKVISCKADGGDVILEMEWENLSDKPVNLTYFGGTFSTTKAVVAGGDTFDGGDVSIKLGEDSFTNMMDSEKMPSKSPVTAFLKIFGVPDNAEMLSKVDIEILCEVWNFKGQKVIQIQNVPITRD